MTRGEREKNGLAIDYHWEQCSEQIPLPFQMKDNGVIWENV